MTLKKTLIELKKLLAKWDLGIDDWSLFLHYADILQGYDIKYGRDSHLHIMIRRDNIPWPVPKEKINEETPVPHNSRYGQDFNNFIKKTGWDFHLLVGEPEYFKKIIANGDTRLLNAGKEKIRTVTALGNLKWGNIYFKKFAKKTSPEVMARRLAWRAQIYREALRKKDLPVIKESKKLLDMFSAGSAKASTNKNIAIGNYKKHGTVKGEKAFAGKVRGKVLLIKNPDKPMKRLKRNFILVAKLTSPKLVGQMKVSKAVVTDEGGLLSHAAILCREFKIPGVIGTLIATQVLKDGDKVEVDANKGIVKKIWARQ